MSETDQNNDQKKKLQLSEDLRLIDPKVRADFNNLPAEQTAKQRAAPTFVLYPWEVTVKQKEPLEIKEEESLYLIKEHLKLHKKAYVASSHGKDSIVLVHLIKRACDELGIPMIEVWLNNTLNIYKEEPEYWKLINKWLDIEDKFRIFLPPKDTKGNHYTVWSIAKEVGHLPSFRRASYGPAWRRKNPGKSVPKKQGQGNATPECCDILKKASIKTYLKGLPKDDRFDLHFVGTRAEESNMRKLGVMQRCRSYLMKTRHAYPIRTVTPLSFWTKTDIYLYFEKYGIPKNPVYDIHKISRMGCSSCPAFLNWEKKMAADPTEQGKGMLKQNLKILKETEPTRYAAAIENLKKNKLAPLIVAELEGTPTLQDYK